MGIRARLSLIIICICAFHGIDHSGHASYRIYVAPLGNDSNPGTVGEPLASLAGARDFIRQLEPEQRNQAITVLFAEGTYKFSGAVQFNELDSGSLRAPIVYRNEQDAVVRFCGGVEISGLTPLKERRIRDRLPDEAVEHVMVADLFELGLTESDLGKIATRGNAGKGVHHPVPEPELFWDEVAMIPARWPNAGFERIKDKIDNYRLRVESNRISRWIDEDEPWIFAYWYHNWADLAEPLQGFDQSGSTILRSDKITPLYGINPAKARWYVFNLLSEIDMPGEYYIDRSEGRIYVWPLAREGHPVLSQAQRCIVTQNLRNVVFQGFTVEAFRREGIVFKGGINCSISASTIRNIGRTGILVQGGKVHTVVGCDVYNVGNKGIDMAGGDRKTLTPGGHSAINNYIHHWSRRNRSYEQAIKVSGVGNRIANNLVHSAPHVALSAAGNDHVVEWNEVHNVIEESGDAGAFYVGRDWTGRGTIIRYNYFHNIRGGAGFGMGVYLDDQYCGVTVHGNIFERCGRAVYLSGGDDNTITNNIFKNCYRSVHLDERGLTWQKKDTNNPRWKLRRSLLDVPYQAEPWSSRYPELVDILEDQPGAPKRNVFARNISAGGVWDDLKLPRTRKEQIIENNLVYDNEADWVQFTKDSTHKLIGIRFKNPAKIKKIGFEEIPVHKIGLYDDPLRASWPVDHPVKRIELGRLEIDDE